MTTNNNQLYFTQMNSPVGKLSIFASDKGLHRIAWENEKLDNQSLSATKKPTHPILIKTCQELKEYFNGSRTRFTIPLVPNGTEFQKKAWSVLQKIPYGKTLSYQEQAKKLGDSKKARAAGTANSRNPISIIIPCHRVIAKNGNLSGFGGGVQNKKILLELEKSQPL